jgi:hypothetical protein
MPTFQKEIEIRWHRARVLIVIFFFMLLLCFVRFFFLYLLLFILLFYFLLFCFVLVFCSLLCLSTSVVINKNTRTLIWSISFTNTVHKKNTHSIVKDSQNITDCPTLSFTDKFWWNVYTVCRLFKRKSKYDDTGQEYSIVFLIF